MPVGFPGFWLGSRNVITFLLRPRRTFLFMARALIFSRIKLSLGMKPEYIIMSPRLRDTFASSRMPLTSKTCWKRTNMKWRLSFCEILVRFCWLNLIHDWRQWIVLNISEKKYRTILKIQVGKYGNRALQNNNEVAATSYKIYSSKVNTAKSAIFVHKVHILFAALTDHI